MSTALETEKARVKRRFACNGPAELHIAVGETPVAARILSISSDGVLIELLSPCPVALDARVELSFSIKHLLFRVRADVKLIRPCGLQIGCRFFSLSQRMLLQIQDLVEELARDEGLRMSRLAPLH